MMLTKNNTQERHKNIYVIFARKYISTEIKARFLNDWQLYMFFTVSAKVSSFGGFPIIGSTKRICFPASTRTLKLT